MFNPIIDNIEGYRARINEMRLNEFTIEGFPIPIVPGKLNTIVAPSHSGKTVYGMGLSMTLAREGYKTLFLTTEEDVLAFVEKTIGISINDEGFKNLSVVYVPSFNRETLVQFMNKVNEEDFEFLVIDYLKKSMWEDYTSDHVVMEEINSTLLKSIGNLSIFAMIQGNRDSFKAIGEESWKDLIATPSQVSVLIDGGMPAYRSADNLLFLRAYQGKREFLVAKCRRNNDLLGNTYSYDVNQITFKITMEEIPNELF